MEVILVNPNIRGRTEKGMRGINVHLPVQSYPPLGIAYLASALEQANIEVKVIDSSAHNLSEDDLIHTIIKYRPIAVAIYVTSFSLPYVKSIIYKMRKNIRTTIVVGGPHITHYPKSTFTLGADYGMVGDGEYNLPRIVQSLCDGNANLNINGLVYKKGSEIVINPKKDVDHLDSIPFPARHLLPNNAYYFPLASGGKVTTMITTRGCIFDCIFCALPTKKMVRLRSSENVIDEIEILCEEGFKYVGLVDDIFTVNMERAARICELIIEKNIKIEWGCETRADYVNEKLLQLMKKAGCTNIHFGVESGSERVRNGIIGKKCSNDTYRKVFKICKQLGLDTVGYFIFGHPTETAEEMQETVAFANELRPTYADFHIAVPIPGSRLFSIAVGEGKITSDIWDKAVSGEPIPFYIPDGISLDYIRNIQKDAYASFYMSPGKIFDEFMRIKNVGDFLNRAKAGIRIIMDKL